MSQKTIVESSLTFGPYAEEHCFHVEASTAYKKLGDGVKIAEFLLLRLNVRKPPQVWVIEAKSSSPRPETKPNFDEYVDEIREKLTNGLGLCLALLLKRHESFQSELSQEFTNLDLSTCGFRFVLVIKKCEEEWLPQLQNALTQSLRSVVKTWALGANAVAVLNEVGARKHGLIR